MDFTMYANQPSLAVGYDVKWIKNNFQIRTMKGYEFCKPRLESSKLPSEKIHEPFDPTDPTLDGVIVDGWIRKRGTAVISVLNNQACWNKDLWAKFGGHPYQIGWDVSVQVTDTPGGPWETVGGFQEIPRIQYDIVK